MFNNIAVNNIIEFKLGLCKKFKKMKIPHALSSHTDFGPGFVGLTSGQCSLGDECKMDYNRTWNRGCSVCKQRLHDPLCFQLHKENEIKKERKQWFLKHPKITKKYYRYLLKEGIISENQYQSMMQDLFVV